jgi:hypothetical protein
MQEVVFLSPNDTIDISISDNEFIAVQYKDIEYVIQQVFVFRDFYADLVCLLRDKYGSEIFSLFPKIQDISVMLETMFELSLYGDCYEDD